MTLLAANTESVFALVTELSNIHHTVVLRRLGYASRQGHRGNGFAQNKREHRHAGGPNEVAHEARPGGRVRGHAEVCVQHQLDADAGPRQNGKDYMEQDVEYQTAGL
jgi:hypothetical protein